MSLNSATSITREYTQEQETRSLAISEDLEYVSRMPTAIEKDVPYFKTLQRQLNVFLKDYKMQKIKVSGYLDKPTRAAINTYQEYNHRPITGVFDVGTTSKLLQPSVLER